MTTNGSECGNDDSSNSNSNAAKIRNAKNQPPTKKQRKRMNEVEMKSIAESCKALVESDRIIAKALMEQGKSDDIDLFFASLAPQLREIRDLSKETEKSVRVKIQQLLMDAQFGYGY